MMTWGPWRTGAPNRRTLICINEDVETREDGPPNPGEWADQAPYYPCSTAGLQSHSRTLISAGRLLPVSMTRSCETTDRIMANSITPSFSMNYGQRHSAEAGWIHQPTARRRPFRSRFELVGIGYAPLLKKGTRLPPKGTNGASADREFKETKRLASERYAFARNPSLIRDARTVRGFECEALRLRLRGDLRRAWEGVHRVPSRRSSRRARQTLDNHDGPGRPHALRQLPPHGPPTSAANAR